MPEMEDEKHTDVHLDLDMAWPRGDTHDLATQVAAARATNRAVEQPPALGPHRHDDPSGHGRRGLDHGASLERHHGAGFDRLGPTRQEIAGAGELRHLVESIDRWHKMTIGPLVPMDDDTVIEEGPARMEYGPPR